MRIECPSCPTSYEIGAAAIPAKGRKLRCGKCSTVWRIMPPDPEPATEASETFGTEDLAAFEAEFSETEPDAGNDEDGMAAAFEKMNAEDEPDDTGERDLAPDAEPEDAESGDAEAKPGILAGLDADLFTSEGIRKVSDGDDGGPDAGGGSAGKESIATIEATVASALAEANEVRSIEAIAARKDKKGGKPSSSAARGLLTGKMLGIASLAASLALVAGLVLARAPIVRAVPDMASLYAAVGLEVNLRGLAFRDIRMLRDVSNGSPVFVVEGLIENVSDRTVRLPEVLFSLRDDAKSELFSWTNRLSLTALPAGEVTRFKTELTTAPAIATDILVRFNDSPQRRAGL